MAVVIFTICSSGVMVLLLVNSGRDGPLHHWTVVFHVLVRMDLAGGVPGTRARVRTGRQCPIRLASIPTSTVSPQIRQRHPATASALDRSCMKTLIIRPWQRRQRIGLYSDRIRRDTFAGVGSQASDGLKPCLFEKADRGIRRAMREGSECARDGTVSAAQYIVTTPYRNRRALSTPLQPLKSSSIDCALLNDRPGHG